MTERILDISESAASLHVRYSQLVIEPQEGGVETTTPLSELAVLVISHPRVLMTQAVISEMAGNGGSVVICDRNHMPAAIMLPLKAHTTQTERFARQTQVSEPLRKRLWRQIVRAKIRAQGRLLQELHGNDGGLGAMSARVLSGDTGNLEAQASRRYWPLLFRDSGFRRGREGPDQNNHLNYGYAVLRAVVARGICAAGLHPSLGLQHHNRYNPFCLADDLMEPFRPLIDRAVYHWTRENDPGQPLDKAAKSWILRPMLDRYEFEGESRTLFDWMARASSSLAQAIMGGNTQLRLPEL
ncbi:MAG TPA: type II CRISPR-associated endonuclease Cas1 [Terriglobales bacterium]|nr:type II CRISPR-associated endonuclease Cas1 [Terriglobales bacterium]